MRPKAEAMVVAGKWSEEFSRLLSGVQADPWVPSILCNIRGDSLTS